MFRTVQSSAVSLLEASTDRLAFSLHAPAASIPHSGRLFFSVAGLRSYRTFGHDEIRLQPDAGETVTTLLCDQVPHLSSDTPCIITVRSSEASPLTVSSRFAARTETFFTEDGRLVCVLMPDAGCDMCEVALESGGSKLLLLRLGFSLSEQSDAETFDLTAAASGYFQRAVTALPLPADAARKAAAPLSASLLTTLATGVFNAAERAAEENEHIRFSPSFLKQFSRFPDKPPLRMLKYWMSVTCRRLSDLAENEPQKTGRAYLLSACRSLCRRLNGRFGKVTAAAPEEPFLEAVGAGPAFADAFAAYSAFLRAADGTLSSPSAEAALSRAVQARLGLSVAALLPEMHPTPSEMLRPLLPSAVGITSDGEVTRLSAAADPLFLEDPLENAQKTACLADFLRDGAIPTVAETERHPLGPALEKELAETDWTRFDMLVGSLGSLGQLSSNLRFRCYYAPVSVLPQPLPAVRYIAVYQSKKSGNDAGIRYFGAVTDCRVVLRRDIPYPVRRNNPEEPYYLFSVRRWQKLSRPIPVREEGVYAPRFTHPFLFRHALESYELFHVTSERDFRLLMTLRSLSAAARPASGKQFSAPADIPLGRDFSLSLAEDRLALRQGGKQLVAFSLSQFAARPLYWFESLRRALADA